MKKYIFLAASIAALLNTSCKKDNAQSPLEIKFHPEGLAYVQLPLNKYFIYKDSSTASLDSVVVTTSTLETKFSPRRVNMPNDPGSPAFYYQTFTLKLTKYNGVAQQDWFYGSATNTLNGAALFLKERDRLTGMDKNYVFNYPFSTSQINISVSVFPSINVEGKTYLNAVKYLTVNGADSTQPNYLKSAYYWVKGVGIIKREIQTSSSVKTATLVRNS